VGRGGISVICTQFCFVLFLWDWDLNSGLHTCKDPLPPEPHLQSILLWLFGDEDVMNNLPGLILNGDSPYLRIPRSYDYRCEPPAPSHTLGLGAGLERALQPRLASILLPHLSSSPQFWDYRFVHHLAH
jgi:hypothetical protein